MALCWLFFFGSALLAGARINLGCDDLVGSIVVVILTLNACLPACCLLSVCCLFAVRDARCLLQKVEMNGCIYVPVCGWWAGKTED